MGRFGHELKRTREIFFNSTGRSLVVLDELSEGTTFEEKMELSEYVLTGFYKLGASTLLVTHNHELCERLQEKGIGRYFQGEFSAQVPTYRLIPGVSKVSHADEWPQRLVSARKTWKNTLRSGALNIAETIFAHPCIFPVNSSLFTLHICTYISKLPGPKTPKQKLLFV